MKRSYLIGSIILNTLSPSLAAQEKPKEKEWDVSPYGWARVDYIFDSRQSAQVREYHLNLYPLDVKKDANGQDINATGASNFLSVVSRLGVNFKGPDVWGAKASGKLEGDFFGNTQESIGLFRIRHAYAQLSWPSTQLTLGQTFYPTFIPDVFPGVANFSTGIPFNPFGWVGQAKIRQKLSEQLFLEAVAYKDREFTSLTGTGAVTNSATYNSLTPTLHAKLEYRTPQVIAGLGAEYQSLQPVIQNATGTLASNEKLNSSLVMGYLRLNTKDVIVKAYGITGGNLSHLVMLGGFGEYTQPGSITTYRPTRTSAGWIDIASTGASIAPGVFFGYSKNHGLEDTPSKLLMRGLSGNRVLDNLWRASARVDFKQNKFRITPEIEYTGATWADLQPNATGSGNATSVGNLRGTISAVYSF